MAADPALAPPADLASRPLPLVNIPAGSVVCRLHDVDRQAIFFGPIKASPPAGRWDAPDESYGVCYAADPATPHAAFVERFLRRPGSLILAMPDLERIALARIRIRRDLSLVRFNGRGLARLHATGAIAHGSHRASRPWSLALHDHPAQPDGIQWRSRLDDDALALAIFDKARAALEPVESPPLLSTELRPTLAAWLDRYGTALI